MSGLQYDLQYYDGSNWDSMKSNFEIHYGLFTPTYVVIFGREDQIDIGVKVRVVDNSSGNPIFIGKVISFKEIKRGIGKYYAYGEFGRMIEDYRNISLYNTTRKDVISTIVGLYNTEPWVTKVSVSFPSSYPSNAMKYFTQKGYTINEIYNLLYMDGYYYSDKCSYDSSSDTCTWELIPIQLNNLNTTYQEGNNSGIYFIVTERKYDKSKIINKIIVQGVDVQKTSVETGTVTVPSSGSFANEGYIKLLHKVSGNVNLTLYDSNNNEINNVDYNVLPEMGVITLSSSYNGYKYKVSYSYYATLAYVGKNDASIAKYGERMKVRKISATTMQELKDYANNILSVFANPPMTAKIFVKGKTLNVGDVFDFELKYGSGYTSAEKVIVYEKIWTANHYEYIIGNTATIVGIIRNIAESLKVDISRLQIANITDLGTDDITITFTWYGFMSNIGGGTAENMASGIGDYSTSGRYIIPYASRYSYIGKKDGYSAFCSSVSGDCVLIDGDGGRYQYEGFDIDLNYQSGTNGWYVTSDTSTILSGSVSSPLTTLPRQGIIFKTKLGSFSSTDEITLLTILANGVTVATLAGKNGTIYLKDTSGNSSSTISVSGDFDVTLGLFPYMTNNGLAMRVYLSGGSSLISVNGQTSVGTSNFTLTIKVSNTTNKGPIFLGGMLRTPITATFGVEDVAVYCGGG